MTKMTEKVFDEISETYMNVEVNVFEDKSEALNHFVTRGYFGPELTYLVDNARTK